MTKPLIWYIHGAASTPVSFNWLKANLPEHDSVDIVYSIDTPLIETINGLRELAAAVDRPLHIIGHSLGGIVAVAIAQTTPVHKIVTIATPFSGSFAASVMRWFMPIRFFREICNQSPIISALHANPPGTPILSIVADSNLVILGERTDGVITVNSQRSLPGVSYVSVPLNHFEVLLSPIVAREINDFIF